MKLPTVKTIIYILVIFVPTLVFGQINLDSSLVGYFPLDSNAIDESALAINGLVNYATLTTGKNNNPDSAYYFNGTNAYINCSSNNRGIVDVVSISVWVKTTTLGLQYVVSKYNWVEDKGYILYVKDGHPELAGRNSSGQYVTTKYVNPSNLINDGNWHYIVAEINGNTWSIWVDCVLDNSVTSNSSNPKLTSSTDLTIGNIINPSGVSSDFYTGSIDEVRIYNRTLTAAERSLLCDINYSGSISAPVVSQDTGVCENELVTLLASSNSGTIYWESPLGVLIDSGNVHSQIITQPTVFYVYSVQNGVSSSNSIITVNTASAVDTSITSNGFSLFSNATNVMYQWIDCENWTLIQGEVGQVFIPTASGYYALAVTNEYCSDTSDCIQVIPLGVSELIESGVRIYPNPTTDIIVVETLSTSRIYAVEVLDVSGKIIYQRIDSFNSKAVVDLSSYRTGMYFIRVSFKESIKVFKVVKE